MNDGRNDLNQHYGYPRDPRDMYIYDDSFVADGADESKVVGELKKMNKKLDSIEKTVKKIEKNMEKRQQYGPQPYPYYY